MGVPLSKTHIATAAHVVDNVTIGDDVKVFHIYNRSQVHTAKLVYYSKNDEIAVLETSSGHSFPTPARCEHSYGGQRIQGERPTKFGKPWSGSYPFRGTVSNITKHPLITDKLEAENKKISEISTQAMAGKDRLFIATKSQTAPGNSGGSIIDIDQKCVVGIASMNGRVSDFQKPESLMKELGYNNGYYEGTAPYILIGVPIVHYSRWFN